MRTSARSVPCFLPLDLSPGQAHGWQKPEPPDCSGWQIAATAAATINHTAQWAAALFRPLAEAVPPTTRAV